MILKKLHSLFFIFTLTLLFTQTINAAVEAGLTLSDTEKTWLSNHPIIRVGMDPDYAPFEWKNEKGDYIGMAVDYLALLGKKLGVTFKIMDTSSWSQALESAKRGEIEMLSSIIQTPKRLEFLLFTKPYRTFPTVIIDSAQGHFVGSLDNLKGKKVAVEKGYFTQEFLASTYPDILLFETQSTLAALSMVQDGRADAYVGDINTINFTIAKHSLVRLHFSGEVDLNNEHRFGVNAKHPELVSILNKTMATVSKQESDVLFDRWLSIRIEKGVTLTTMLSYGAFLVGIILFLAYWTYRLRREMKYAQRLEEREECHKLILEMIAKSEPLGEVLNAIMLSVEKQNKGAMCSIILIDTQTKKIIKGIAPNLPKFYNEAIIGLEMQEGIGSCGTAIATKQRVIVEDIATHPYWSLFKEMAEKAELGACWSEPVFSSSNEAIGSFAIYHKVANTPSALDLMWIEQSAYLASIALEKEKTESTLRESEAYYRTLTEDVSDVIWKVDSNFIITYVSPSDERLRGFKAEEMIGHHVFEMFTKEGIDTLKKAIADRQSSEANGVKTEMIAFEIEHVCKDGSLKWGEILSKPERDEEGKIIGYHGITREITERKRMQAQVEYLAFYDALTGLPNRVLLQERLLHALEASKRSQKYSAMMFLDLDNFKALNDMHGHTIGDELLAQAAQRLKKSVRALDTVARFGGDEFVIILQELDEDKRHSKIKAEAVAKKILLSLSAEYCLNKESMKADMEGVEHYCTVSIGITLIHPTLKTSYDDLLNKADTAMYKAKEAGKNTILFDE